MDNETNLKICNSALKISIQKQNYAKKSSLISLLTFARFSLLQHSLKILEAQHVCLFIYLCFPFFIADPIIWFQQGTVP